jgi:hypothetical protein
VRPEIWVLLAGVALVAALLPVAVYIHAASSPITARACVAPTNPRVGQQAYLVIQIVKPADQAALHGPWGRVEAQWDMPAMSMGSHLVSFPGGSITSGTLKAPLTFDMSGAWRADVTIHTPGRPVWRQTMVFTVGGPPSSAGVSPLDVHIDSVSAPCDL